MEYAERVISDVLLQWQTSKCRAIRLHFLLMVIPNKFLFAYQCNSASLKVDFFDLLPSFMDIFEYWIMGEVNLCSDLSLTLLAISSKVCWYLINDLFHGWTNDVLKHWNLNWLFYYRDGLRFQPGKYLPIQLFVTFSLLECSRRLWGVLRQKLKQFEIDNQRAINQSVVNKSAIDRSAVNRSANDRSAIDRNAIDRNAIDQSAVNPSSGNLQNVYCWCIQKLLSFMSPILWLFGIENAEARLSACSTSGLELETVYAFHQSAVKKLVNVSDGAETDGYAARILPPACQLECCSSNNLPQLNTLYNNIFKRKPDQFIPDQNNRNVLYSTFYQYFVLQFFDENSNLMVTASQLYGSDHVSERSMRSFCDGKLNTLQSKYKHYAPNQSFALRSNVYLNAVEKKSLQFNWLITLSKMMGLKLAQAEVLSTSPLLFVLSTLWVREHNRVCDELSKKTPSWTDEELYTRARKIVTGQMMTIMMNEILNVKLKPEVYHHRMENISGSGTPIELYLTMAVSSLPEKLQCCRQVLEDRLKDNLKCMVNSKMGMVTAHNDGASTEQLTKTLIVLSREHRLQGFNNYRRRLGLPAYNSFLDLTGNNETATKLENLYGTVENVELLTGVLTEKSSSIALPTAKVLSNSFIINAILTNNLTAKHSWAPDTFGGVEFFDLVKSTSLKSLVHRNVDVNPDELQVQLYAK